jgi:protein-L-isoaspartate(D-aspartate) O-methyltransferase
MCCFSKEEKSVTQVISNSYAQKRQMMIENQLRPRGIKDEKVIKSMLKVKRHLFVPENVRAYAYDDKPLPIGYDQTISQPYIVAYMTEALSLTGDEKVLEIGTGSGYQAAVLAEILNDVYTIEIIEPLAKRAMQALKSQKYHNVHTRIGDGYAGWEEKAPFDKIIITAAPPKIPEPLFNQLKEGGEMVVPVGTWFQELILVQKKNGKMVKKRLLPVRFVPMTGEIQKKKHD